MALPIPPSDELKSKYSVFGCTISKLANEYNTSNARNTEVRILDKSDASSFHNKYHIHGSIGSIHFTITSSY